MTWSPGRGSRIARWVYGLAGLCGLIILVPTYFMAEEVARASVPISHLENYYGFTGQPPPMVGQFERLLSIADFHSPAQAVA